MVNPYTRDNPGNFAHDPERARKAGAKGGEASPGKFKKGTSRARQAGKKGGSSTAEKYLEEARKLNARTKK